MVKHYLTVTVEVPQFIAPGVVIEAVRDTLADGHWKDAAVEWSNDIAVAAEESPRR
jgi:hypothetical protein